MFAHVLKGTRQREKLDKFAPSLLKFTNTHENDRLKIDVRRTQIKGKIANNASSIKQGLVT